LHGEYGHTWWSPGYKGYSDSQLLTLPRVTTETGWQTEGKESISEEQQARVFLNLYLAAFKRNWSYTFIYMLRDDPGQGSWGLFHVDYTPKRSAVWLHNLTTILTDKDSAKPVSTGSLNYSIVDEPATAHELLLQKGDGQFELAVWGESAKGTNNITVTLPGIFSTVNVYDPTVGISPVQTFKDVSTVQLAMSDHPFVIEPEDGKDGKRP